MTEFSEQSAPGPLADLVTAAGRFFPGGAVSAVNGSGSLMRVDTGAGVAVVRQWPAETTREHVEFVHAVHASVQAADFPLIASILPLAGEAAMVLALNGRLYDGRSWLPGEPLSNAVLDKPTGAPIDLPSVVSETAFAATIEAIARLHQASTGLTRRDQRLTIRQMRQAARQLWQVYRERLRPAAPSNPPVQHWFRTGERVLPMALALLDQEPDLAQAASVVGHHRLWPAHVLRQHQDGAVAISGLVGLSDPAWGTPLLDLVQIATRFARWTPELVEAVIGTYSAVRRLAPDERRLLPAVATLDLLVQAGHLLDLTYHSGADTLVPTASSPMVVAVESMIANLEAVGESLAALAPRERAAGLRHRRGPRPGPRPPRSRSGPSRQRRDHLT